MIPYRPYRLSALLTLLIIGITGYSQGQNEGPEMPSEESLAAANRVLEVSQTKKMLDMAMEQVRTMQKQQIQSLGLDEDNAAKAQEIMDKTQVALDEFLNWEDMKESIATSYAKVFTVDELNKLAEFYESEVGQKFIEKSPQLMQEMMTRMQQRMPQLQQRLHEITQEVMAEEDSGESAPAPEDGEE